MKKILLLGMLAFCTSSLFAQTWPVLQTLGSSGTKVESKGAFSAQGGFVNKSFADTAAANVAAYIKNTPYTQIMVGDSLFLRNSAGTKWINVTPIVGGLLARNGITLTGSYAELGGTLIQHSTIASAGYNLNFTGVGSFGIGMTASTNPITQYKLEVFGTGALAKFVSDNEDVQLELSTTLRRSFIGDYATGMRFYDGSTSKHTIQIAPTIGDTAAGLMTVAGPMLVQTDPNNAGINIWKGPYPHLAHNTGLGVQTLDSIRVATGNRLIGVIPDTFTVASNLMSQYNTAIGAQALANTKYSSDNTAVGAQALYANEDGFYNVAVGHYALGATVHGIKNTGVGTFSLNDNISGSSNSAFGFRALRSNVAGFYNVAMGEDALYLDTAGIYNTGIGYRSLSSGQIGNYNTALGAKSGFNASGSNNTLIGYSAGTNITTGTENTILGYNSGTSINTGTGNTILGANYAGSSSLTNNIVIANGTGAVKAQHDGSNWEFQSNVGIATASPYAKLHVSLETTQMALFGGNNYGTANGSYSGIALGYSEASSAYQKSRIVQEQIGDGNAVGKIHILNNISANTSAATLSDARLTVGNLGNVGINNTSPDASAILDVSSATKGFLPPRMTTTERNAISSPATGLMIFNTTTTAFEWYTGSSWVKAQTDNIYTADGTLTADRTLSGSGNDLTLGAIGSPLGTYLSVYDSSLTFGRTSQFLATENISHYINQNGLFITTNRVSLSQENLKQNTLVLDSIKATLFGQDSILLDAPQVRIQGSLSLPLVSKTSTYTATVDDYTIECTSGTFTVNLPAAAGVRGRVYIIKNTGAGTITIDPNSSETIDGLSTVDILGDKGRMIQSNGSNWIIIGAF